MKHGIIIASFGTTYCETRQKTLELIESEIKNKFQNFEIAAAYTSGIVRSILKKRDGILVDSIEEAVFKLTEKGCRKIYIQPTHIIPGFEYEKLKLDNTILGKTLLNEKADFDKIVSALELQVPPENTALVFMGHGSSNLADEFYKILETKIQSTVSQNIFIGTVEGKKTIADILSELKLRNIRNVKMCPFMMVAGDHAHNDMAGDDDESWKSVLENAGYNVSILLKGIGEYEGIRRIIYESLEKTIAENS